jgi:purine nucleoside phosphorylase
MEVISVIYGSDICQLYIVISIAINTSSNPVFGNPSYTDEYTGITATSTVHSYYHHERYHQTPEKQTENPKITYQSIFCMFIFPIHR